MNFTKISEEKEEAQVKKEEGNWRKINKKLIKCEEKNVREMIV